MLPDWTVVGFTGHRHLADPPAVAAAISAALDGLAAGHPSMLTITSLAAGADTLFVREVARRGLPFVLVFPFPGQRFQQDFPREEWLALGPLRDAAAHIDEVSGLEGDAAYMESGVRIVDLADVVVAVWDGAPAAGFGGTGDVVAYARDLRKPLLWLDPVSGAVVQEHFDRLRPAPSVAVEGTPRQAVERHFRALDEAASRKAPDVRHLIQRVVLLHLAATVAGLVALALDIHGVAGYAVAAFEVLVLGIAFTLTAKRRHGHVEWMKARVEAELCRSFLATWPIRARIDPPPRLAFQGFERLARNLRLVQLMDRSPLPPLESARDAYLGGRVRHQLGYFGRQHEKAARAFRGLKRLAMVCTALAALAAGGHLVLSVVHAEGPMLTATELLSLVLPLVSTAVLSLIVTQEYARRASRYREMVALLEELALRVAAVRTWPGLTQVATEVEAALLSEVLEWHTYRRFAGAAH